MKTLKDEINYFSKTFVDKDVLNSANNLVHIDDRIPQRMVWGNNRSKEVFGFTAEEVIDIKPADIQKYYHPGNIIKFQILLIALRLCKKSQRS